MLPNAGIHDYNSVLMHSLAFRHTQSISKKSIIPKCDGAYITHTSKDHMSDLCISLATVY